MDESRDAVERLERTEAGSRSLKTAATVLRALRLLGDSPVGLCAAELAAELDKSVATARYMINTLCDAGYAERDRSGRCRLTEAPPWGTWGPGAPAGLHPRSGPLPGDPDPGALLAEAATELYRITRQRSYLVRRTGTVVATVVDSRGHQGLARLPGLETHVPPQHAHALAMTKVLLACSPAYREAVECGPLEARTPQTITDESALRAELDLIRERGVAIDAEEYADGFATVAAPIVGPSGTATVALGLSCSSRRLGVHEEELIAAVRAVADRAGDQWAAEVPPAPRPRTSTRATRIVSGPRR